MTDWSPLTDELARWHDTGLSLPIWWRDDDAVSDTPELCRLVGMASDAGLPIHVAIVPSQADASLAARVATSPGVRPLVHGWAHTNHAPSGQKKAEFGASRPLADRTMDAQRGLNHLQDMLGDRLVPIFVPPWNRIGDDMLPALLSMGFRAVSTFTPRPRREAIPGLTTVNTHVDPIDWRGSRSLVNPRELIAQTTALLQARRAGQSDMAEPLGLLTHHLVHDPAIWSFCADWIGVMLTGPVIPWDSKQENAI